MRTNYRLLLVGGLLCAILCGSVAAATAVPLRSTTPPSGFSAELIQTSDSGWVNVTTASPIIAGPSMPYDTLTSTVALDSVTMEPYTEEIGREGPWVEMNNTVHYLWLMPFKVPGNGCAILDMIRFPSNSSAVNALKISVIWFEIYNTTIVNEKYSLGSQIFPNPSSNGSRIDPINENVNGENWTTKFTTLPYLNASKTTNNVWWLLMDFQTSGVKYTYKYSNITTPSFQPVNYNISSSQYDNYTINGQYFTPIVDLVWLPDNVTNYGATAFTVEGNSIVTGSSKSFTRITPTTTIGCQVACTSWPNYTAKVRLTSEYRLSLTPTFTPIETASGSGGIFNLTVNTPLLGTTKSIKVLMPSAWSINAITSPDTGLHFTTTTNSTHHSAVYTGNLLTVGDYKFTVVIPVSNNSTDSDTDTNTTPDGDGKSIDGMPMICLMAVMSLTTLRIIKSKKHT